MHLLEAVQADTAGTSRVGTERDANVVSLAAHHEHRAAEVELLCRSGAYPSQMKTTDGADLFTGPWYTASTLVPSGSRT